MMSRRVRLPLVLLVGVLDVAVGAALVARPDAVAAAVSNRAEPAAGWIRLLGVRHLAQGVVELGWPRAGIMAGSAGVDALHGLSMIALASIKPEYRQPALVSAGLATAGAATTALAAHQLRSAHS